MIPVISIVMPLYNKEKDVDRSLRSVLAQKMQHFELIVVNDGSTDRSSEIVKAWKDHRIRVIDQPNQGVSAARNNGIREAQADLVAFLDADDEWMPDFLETILNLRENFPDCEVFSTSYWFSTPEGVRRKALLHACSKSLCFGVLNDYFSVAARSDPPLWTSAVAVNKTALEIIKGFPADVNSGEDLLTWARLAVKYKIAYSNKPCAIHYNPADISDRPWRIPQQPDIVEQGLIELMNNVDVTSIPGLKSYIALWHRMRAIIFIQLGERKNALKEIKRAMQFAPSMKLLILFIILGLPGHLPAKTLMFIKTTRASY